MKTLRHSLWLTLLLLAGCSVIQSQEGSPIPEDGQFAVLPLINLSQTPQAGDQAASVLSAILRAKGSENVTLYLPDDRNPCCTKAVNDSKQLSPRPATMARTTCSRAPWKNGATKVGWMASPP